MATSMTPTLRRAVERLRGLPAREQDRIGQRLLEALPAEDVPADPDPKTLGDWLEGYIGTFDSREHVPGGAHMSEDAGRKFADGLEEKRKQGRL